MTIYMSRTITMIVGGPSCPGHLSGHVIWGECFGIRQRWFGAGPIARFSSCRIPLLLRRQASGPCCSLCAQSSPLSLASSPLPPQSLYVATCCQLRRLESASYSSVCSHLAETFQGSQVVRAFQAQGPFTAQHDALMDENQRISFPRLVADR